MENTLIVYDCASKKFRYPDATSEQFLEKSDKHPLWEIMWADGLTSHNTAERFKKRIQEIEESETSQVCFEEYFIKKTKHMWKWYRVGFICAEPGKTINITFTDVAGDRRGVQHSVQKYGKDDLTGLLNRKAFCEAVGILQVKRFFR